MATTPVPVRHLTPGGRALPRPLRDAEQVMDVDGILDAMDEAKDHLNAIGEAWRATAARAVLDHLPAPPAPAGALDVLRALRLLGGREAVAELRRLGVTPRGVRDDDPRAYAREPTPATVLQRLLAYARRTRPPAVPPGLRGPWVRFTASLGTQAMDLALAYRDLAPEMVGRARAHIQARMLERVPGLAGTVATMISGPFARGLDDVFSVHADALGGFEYTAILDGGTCPVCRDLDGTRYATVEEMYRDLPDFGPNPRCRGGFRCRCRGVPLPPEKVG